MNSKCFTLIEPLFTQEYKLVTASLGIISLQCRRFGARDRKFAAILVWEKWVGRGWGRMEENACP